MAGSSLDRFADFTLATREHSLTGPDDLVSQASRYNTYFVRKIFMGRTKPEIVQGGTKIVDHLQLSFQNSFAHFNFDDDHQYSASDTLTRLEVPWRASKVSEVIRESEVDLNQGDEKTVFKRVKRAKQSNMELSFWEGMEDSVWADPNYDTMEAPVLSGTGAPYSLRAFVTMDGTVPKTSGTLSLDDGLVPGSTATWPTVMTASPTTFANWRNKVATFDNTNLTTREATFIPAMDQMWARVQFESPSNSEEFVRSTKLQKLCIVINLPTHLLLVKLATARNNVLTPNHDIGWANGLVTYHGIPTKYIAKLDDIDGNESATDTGSVKKYRARYLNLNHFKIIMHSKHNRRMQIIDAGAAQPFTKIMLEDTWWNLWCGNRREQGMVRAA